MTHVVTDNCTGCRFTECVEVCPVECFHQSAEMVYIDPDVCIDCAGCIPACPVQAIVDEINLADGDKHWVETNRMQSASLPLITAPQDPLPTAPARRKALGL